MSQTKTAYVKMPAELSRQVRHAAIEQGTTVNTVIVEAIRRHMASGTESAAAVNVVPTAPEGDR